MFGRSASTPLDQQSGLPAGWDQVNVWPGGGAFEKCQNS